MTAPATRRSRGRGLTLLGVAASLASAVACSLGATDGLSGGSGGPGAEDAGTAALAPPPPPGSSPAPDDSGNPQSTPENLLANPGFESGCSGGWGFRVDPFGKADQQPGARGGALACEVCSTAFVPSSGQPAGYIYVYEQKLTVDAEPGDVFEGEIWHRREIDDDNKAPDWVVASLELVSEVDGGVVEGAKSAQESLGDTWKVTSTRLEVKSGGKALRFSVAMWRSSADTTCALFDDARVAKVK